MGNAIDPNYGLIKYVSPKMGSGEIDEMIKENIRKQKLLKEYEHLKLREKELNLRAFREQLNERNIKIREMNLRSVKKEKNDNCSVKIPWGADQRRIISASISKQELHEMLSAKKTRAVDNTKKKMSPEERKSNLGLDILYLKGSFKRGSAVVSPRNSIGIKESGDVVLVNSKGENSRNHSHPYSCKAALSKEKKMEIQQYITQQQDKFTQDLKKRKEEEKKKKNRIAENMTKLAGTVRGIFSSNRQSARRMENETGLANKSRGKKIKKGKTKKSPIKKAEAENSANDKDYTSYLKILRGIQKEEQRLKQGDKSRKSCQSQCGIASNQRIMEKIKQDLLKEINAPENRESPPSSSLIESSLPLGRSASQPQLMSSKELADKIQIIKQRYEDLKQKAGAFQAKVGDTVSGFRNKSIINNMSATKIQAIFRGYRTRKAYHALLLGKLALEGELVKNKESTSSVEGKLHGLESKDQNEKIVNTSQINTSEPIVDQQSKIENQKAAVPVAETALSQPQLPPSLPPSLPASLPSPSPPPKPVITLSIASISEITILPISKPQAVKQAAEVEIQVSSEIPLPKQKTEDVPEKKPIEVPTQAVNSAKPEEETKTSSQPRAAVSADDLLKSNIGQSSHHTPLNLLSLSKKFQKLPPAAGASHMEPMTPDPNTQNDSLEQLIETEFLSSKTPPSSIFDRNSFRQFTIKKYGGLMKNDNLSKLLRMREKVIVYREKREKKFIKEMLKAKQFSPRTYQSKRKELEKWVKREKEEITKTKKQMIDNWAKTALMIEDAHLNAMRMKKFFVEHAVSSSYGPGGHNISSSEVNSTFSQVLDSSRHAGNGLLMEDADGLMLMSPISKSMDDRNSSVSSLSNKEGKIIKQEDVLKQEEEHENTAGKKKPSKDAILIQENESPRSLNSPPTEGKMNQEVAQKSLSENQQPITIPSENPQSINSSKKDVPSVVAALDEEIKNVSQAEGIEWEIDLPSHGSSGTSLGGMPKDGAAGSSAMSQNSLTGAIQGPGLKPTTANDKEETKNQKEEEMSTPPNASAALPPPIQNVNNAIIDNKDTISNSTTTNIDASQGKASPLHVSPEALPRGTTTTPEPKLPTVVSLPPPVFQSASDQPGTAVKKEKLADELTEQILKQLLLENLSKMFPARDPLAGKQNANTNTEVQSPNNRQAQLLLLATKKKKGIQTDLYYINNYLDELFAEIMNTQKAQFMGDVNMPIPKPPLEILAKLQAIEADPRSQPPMQLAHEVNPIVSLDIYLEVEKKKEVSKRSNTLQEENQEGNDKNSQSQMFFDECEHIHNKAIFDCVNEALNLIRPYGATGEPMPWSTQQRILFTKIGEPSIILRNIKNMVLDWGAFEAGTMPKMDFVIAEKFDEEYFTEVREKRLVNLLAQEVIDNEEQWTNYEMEEAEVKVDLADMIMEHLVTEAVEILNGIEKRRKEKGGREGIFE